MFNLEELSPIGGHFFNQGAILFLITYFTARLSIRLLFILEKEKKTILDILCPIYHQSDLSGQLIELQGTVISLAKVRVHCILHACLVAQSCLTLCDPRQPSRLLCPWDFTGKSTGVGCHVLLQEIFLTQERNPHFLHWQADS